MEQIDILRRAKAVISPTVSVILSLKNREADAIITATPYVAGIHKTAVVESPRIGDNVTIGAYCVIGPDVCIEADVMMHPAVVVMGHVFIGAGAELFPGGVVGKPPARSPALTRVPARGDRVVLGRACSVGAHAVIYEGVTIGDESLVGDSASIREHNRIGARCIVGRFVSVHPGGEIGDASRIYDHTHLTTGIRIGRHCFLGMHVSTASDPSLGREPLSAEQLRGPILGDRVSVGAGAIILPGVQIGDDAVVAAGACVTRDVPQGTRVRGLPARPVLADAQPEQDDRAHLSV